MTVDGDSGENMGTVDSETPTSSDAQRRGRGRPKKPVTPSENAPTADEPSTSEENNMGMRENIDDAGTLRPQNHGEQAAPLQIRERRRPAWHSEMTSTSSSSSSSSILLKRSVGPPKQKRMLPQAVATPEERIETDGETMNSATVCCDDRDLQHHAASSTCSGNASHRIAPGQPCWKARNGDMYWYCLKCFKSSGENKEEYFKTENINQAVEEILMCSRCSDRYHKCCAFFYGSDSSRFVCHNCDKTAMVKRTVNAKQKCELANFISKKLNDLLEQLVGKETASRHPFRVVGFSVKKSTPIEDFTPNLFKEEFENLFTKVLKYLSRALYVYQRIDEVDVISFTLFSLECDRNMDRKLCQIDYIDSVPYFKVFQNLKRGAIHEVIILAYYEYMTTIGYKHAPLWAEPATPHDDYAFHIHPLAMKFLNGDELIGYYRRNHESGVRKGILQEFNNFKEENKDGKFDSPEKIPILPGSLWSIVMKEIEEEVMRNKKTDNTIKLKEQFWRKLKQRFPQLAENNFFITLPVPAAIQERVEETNSHEFLDDRIKFLDKCAKENWEFVNLRRAKYASVGISQMLLEQEEDEEQEEENE
ncbi:hypothetical protein GCK72_025922 [Caenorhabditis remanei]|uniref:histone acetyltransferase n=1 Tax=Caenorhabditis remanei TaxID=31234 RepID=A0A6A5G4E5_CAERE|nr:hypothetical protein GCK72_025922 [Caenorhabditis remanei]KAF1749454.1 hypothetical protein GCK72_025922 [Caenorhabditis remanei]